MEQQCPNAPHSPTRCTTASTPGLPALPNSTPQNPRRPKTQASRPPRRPRRPGRHHDRAPAAPLQPDGNGGIHLTIGEVTQAALFAEHNITRLAAVTIAPLPRAADYATTTWLLAQNLYTSSLAPFRLACDEQGTVLLWGRIPLDGLTGTTLATLIDAVAAEAARIPTELAET